MLKQRILNTLKYFNLQGTPLTLLDLHKFLLSDMDLLSSCLDKNWEITEQFSQHSIPQQVSVGQILECLETECLEETHSNMGLYVLKGKENLISEWLNSYYFGIQREKLIKKYLQGLRFVPFIRGVAVLGSQAFGLYKKESDIDLLILTHSKHMWLTRFLVAAYFQIIFKRRHGNKIANKFCLNHFIVEQKALFKDRNIYTAAEYLKMRPVVLSAGILNFQDKNKDWINFIFPNLNLPLNFPVQKPAKLQEVLENILSGKFGQYLENFAKKIQYHRINTGEFIMATDEELSFHPNNRKKELFRSFFENQ